MLTYSDTSDESKQHSKDILDKEYNGGDIDTSSGDKNPNNVAGGLKAYTNPYQFPILEVAAKMVSGLSRTLRSARRRRIVRRSA